MTCTERIAELVECARRRTQPGRELRAHLSACGQCGERWESERRLTDELSAMRMRATALMAEDTQHEVLMRDFAALHGSKRESAGRGWGNAMRSWALGLAAAAAVFVFMVAGHIAATHERRPAAPVAPAHGVRNAQTVYYETNYDETAGYESGDYDHVDAGSLAGDFTAVPYTAPLAQGELVRVIHADLYPEALASMGIDVDPAEPNEIPTEVVVGEDGIPRAVRISGSAQ